MTDVRNSPSLVTLAAALVLAFGLLACRQVAPSSSEGTAPGPDSGDSPDSVKVMVDRIVYVGAAGDLFAIDPDGGSLVNLTGGAQVQGGPQGRAMAQPLDLNNFYYWPTWSPDGTKLAASRVESSGLGPVVSVEVLDAASGGARTVYRNEVPSLIAQDAPHYLYWSPDSRYLTFLASTPQAFALLAVDTENGGQPAVVEIGAPLYFHWGNGGEQLLLHTGNSLKQAQRPFAASSTDLADVGQGFRAPAISPDGAQMAYSAPAGDD